MTREIKQDVYGIMKNGTRVHLAEVALTDQEVREILTSVEEVYNEQNTKASITFDSSVYRVFSFVGLQITPPAKPIEQ